MAKKIHLRESMEVLKEAAMGTDLETTRELLDLATVSLHVDGLMRYINSLQHFQTFLARENKGFQYLPYHARQTFFNHPESIDPTDFNNHSTAGLMRNMVALFCSIGINGTVSSTPLQIVASLPFYTDVQQLSVSIRSQYMYHWGDMATRLTNYYRLKDVFNKDIEQLIKVRNNERTPRTMDECIIWDTDLIYERYFAKSNKLVGRAPRTPLGEMFFQI